MAALDPMPQQDPITNDPDRPKAVYFLGGRWLQWFYNLWVRVGLCASRTGFVQVKNQTLGIAATPITGTSSGGRQRVNWYLSVSTGDPAATLQIKFLWTESSVVLNLLTTQLAPPAAGNVLSGVAYLETDAAAPIDYAVLYSNPGGPLVYRLTVAVESMP